LPPAFLIVQMVEVKEASVRAICAPVEEETVRAQTGVEVPRPRLTSVPPLGVTPR